MIRNEVIFDKVRMAYMVDKMREASLNWFGHIKKRCVNAPARKYEKLTLAR